MTFEEQAEYRNRKLAYFVRTQLYPYSPFYRKLFDENGVKPEEIRTVKDLRRLPFTCKEDLAPTAENPARPEDFVLQPDEQTVTELKGVSLIRNRLAKLTRGEYYPQYRLWRKFGPVHIQFTAGTSALPTPIAYAGDDVLRMNEAGRRILDLCGFGKAYRYPEVRVVNAMPFAPHLGFWMVANALDDSGVFSIHAGGGRILGTTRIISAIENMGATGIVGMPSYVYHLLRVAAESRCDFSSVKIVLVAGERIPEGMRDKMSLLLEDMGARDFKIVAAFGFTEARKSYSECLEGAENTGYHTYPDMDYLEIVDPDTGEVLPDGEGGELVYSCLEGQGTVLLRFRTGDFVEGGIVHEPCPMCGRIVPRLVGDISRGGAVKGILFKKIKGTLVNVSAFREVLSEHPSVREWQVEIDKARGDPFEVDVMNVYVVPGENAEFEVLSEELKRLVFERADIKPNRVEFLSMEEMLERLKVGSETKELHVVDKRFDH